MSTCLQVSQPVLTRLSLVPTTAVTSRQQLKLFTPGGTQKDRHVTNIQIVSLLTVIRSTLSVIAVDIGMTLVYRSDNYMQTVKTLLEETCHVCRHLQYEQVLQERDESVIF